MTSLVFIAMQEAAEKHLGGDDINETEGSEEALSQPGQSGAMVSSAAGGKPGVTVPTGEESASAVTPEFVKLAVLLSSPRSSLSVDIEANMIRPRAEVSTAASVATPPEDAVEDTSIETSDPGKFSS